MIHETQAESMATFVAHARYDLLPVRARHLLKAHVLDALGCAIGALDADPIDRLRREIDLFGGKPLATFIGGGQSSPDRVALYNGALVRYLDFNDAFLASGETCHPSDNLAPVLTASEFAGHSGKDFLTAYVRVYANNYWIALPLAQVNQALLCNRLNGAPLTQEHGAPWRLVISGGACFTSVKWVSMLELAAEPGDDTAERIARSRIATNDTDRSV